MTAQVALLRAVNLGAHGKVAMADLRALFAGLGFSDVQTLLQSGNVVFRGPAADERHLEAAAEQSLALRTEIMVRTAAEIAALVAGNPFAEEAERDPAHLVVMFLKAAPAKAAEAALQAAIKGPEYARVAGRHAYIVYPAGIGRSKLTNAVIEKQLGTGATGRNWSTVLKLRAAAGEK